MFLLGLGIAVQNRPRFLVGIVWRTVFDFVNLKCMRTLYQLYHKTKQSYQLNKILRNLVLAACSEVSLVNIILHNIWRFNHFQVLGQVAKILIFNTNPDPPRPFLNVVWQIDGHFVRK